MVIDTYRSLWQVPAFEYQTHYIWQLDDFTTHQAQLKSVTKHGQNVIKNQGNLNHDWLSLFMSKNTSYKIMWPTQ